MTGARGLARLAGPEEIAATVTRLAAEIEADHPNDVVLVGVLKGALIFLADLVRAIRGVDVVVDFVAISRFAPDSGRVRILHDVATDLTGRDVVLVEDLVDTGLTATYLMRQLEERGSARVDLCALLDRSVARIVPLEVRYRGIEIADEFVLGYGLHLVDLYRNLDAIYVADRSAVLADPTVHLDALYPGRRGVGSTPEESP